MSSRVARLLMMNILLTGGGGYLGSYLLSALLKQGHRVVVLKRSTTCCARLTPWVGQFDFVDSDKESLEKAFLFYPIDLVIHTATCYGRYNESFVDIFESNVVFPLKLLEMAIKFKVKRFFNTDTFFNAGSVVAYNYLSQYALSKNQFSEWGRLLSSKYNFYFLNLKLEHIYGPRCNPGTFIHSVVNACLTNVKELPLTAGTQKRDFIYVEDVVQAYMRLLDFLPMDKEYYRDIEVGTGKPISIRFFVELFHELSGSATQLSFGALPMREHEFKSRKADTSFLRKLGWAPQHSLKLGLQKMIQEARSLPY
jgi:CDP-paratose synthetase